MTIALGVTGSRHGMSLAQRLAMDLHLVENQMWWSDVSTLHHGCCTGVDEEFSLMVHTIHPHVEVEGYPPTDERYLSTRYYADRLHEPAPYLDRNKAIVDRCDVLFGFPAPSSRGTKHALSYATAQYRHKPRVYVVGYDDGLIHPLNREGGSS